MNSLTRLLIASTLLAGSALIARPAHAQAEDEGVLKLGEAKRAIASMRETYANVVRKEQAAKSENDAVRLNCVHQNSGRIADLVSVADHAFDDMRIAVTTHQSPEAIDGELEKITLAKKKVEQSKSETDKCVGIKMIGTDSDGTGTTSRELNQGGGGGGNPFSIGSGSFTGSGSAAAVVSSQRGQASSPH